jgi:hypothetical protein
MLEFRVDTFAIFADTFLPFHLPNQSGDPGGVDERYRLPSSLGLSRATISRNPWSLVEHRTQFVFLLLILAQAAHSVEEYATRLYEVFPPARFVSSLICNNLALGFLVATVVLVTFGLWCWAIPVRLGWRAAYGLVWFWTLLELGNGIGHSANAVARKGYFPGVMTAPLLLLLAAWLAVLQARQGGQRRS